MEALYHQTNRLLQEVTTNDLTRIERTPGQEEYNAVETVITEKLNQIRENCSRLDILINKEPPTRRANAKYRVDQLKYDFQHVEIFDSTVCRESRRQGFVVA